MVGAVVSVEELADGVARAGAMGEDGTPVAPVVGVVLDGPREPGALGRAVERLAAHDGVLVGLTDSATPPEAARVLAPYLDLTLARSGRALPRPYVGVPDPRAELEHLQRQAEANPQAAFTLGGVLRAGVRLDVAQALDLESFAYSTLLSGREFAAWLATRGDALPPAEVAEPVLLSRDGDSLHITLNRPERRNAYGRQVRDALVEALAVAEFDPTVRRVLLDGAGPVFSAGGDLAEFGTAADLALAHFLRTRAGVALPLHRLRDRVTVRVHGTCVGAGVELPAFAGTVVASPGTTFRLPEVAMGLIPGAGGTVSLPRRIGRWRTLHLALANTPLDAETALAWGLVDRLG
ncbi:enoyl-CoA hydratase/isomerase family protein [Actinocorallia sp. A-T 12471]|uniref:enoyl-CoA hydratase/isomerase family protein n=1 Tax=Actinocorallia sp. A-T 12471 TaxID=3089813 RepID=UPI0029D35787|nr:enoyl-CoA hydratase/isomerase family protein [Actinocorallia sp. A-T 12471]MDX6739213.1 enoyl-CoA hydratase/isomerase family protein [Actinocorallia sp. A-T 12471]